MNRTKIIVVLSGFVMMTAVVLAGCAKKTAPEKASNLVLSVDQSRQALQGTKEHIQVTTDAANAVGQTEGGNLNADLQRLTGEVAKLDEWVATFRKRVVSMNETSDKFFTNWTTGLDNFSTEEFRKHSEARMEITRGRYNQVLTSMQHVDEKFQPFLAKLHDLVLFLNQNLNPEGVASIKNSADGLNTEASDLNISIDAAVQEADSFTQVLSA